MKPKTYRRLTHFLFAFLFVMFFLLYLLLGGAGRMPRKGGGGGWGKLHREMGTIRLSEVRSGGFALEELPVQEPTELGGENFNENVLRCDATLYNEGEGPIQVTLSVFGTQVLGTENRGLTGTYTDYSPEEEPFKGGDYAAWLSQVGLTRDPEGVNMTLYLSGGSSKTLTLEVGETRQLSVLFWVDAAQVESLTNLDRGEYSATVKLISRGID